MKLSVVVPIYNEGLAIAGNVSELEKTLENSQYDYELVLVNDGSADNTLQVIENLARANRKIKVVSYMPNRGRGFALKTGFKNTTGDYVVATESDLNWGSGIVLALADKLSEGTDMAIASPHMPGGGMENVPFARWALSYFGNKVFALAFPGITMATGMTRGYRGNMLRSLDLESDDKELHVEILHKVLKGGHAVAEIPAILRWKVAKPGETVRKSHFKLRSVLSHFYLGARLIRERFLGV